MDKFFHKPPSDKSKSFLGAEILFSGSYWEEMRVFLAVAKCKSYSKAAILLNRSVSTVSRKVKRLQDVVGTQLIISTLRGTHLTEKGVQLANVLAELDFLISTVSQELRIERQSAEGTVRILVTEELATTFIIPNMGRISNQYPKIQLVLQTPTNNKRLWDNSTDIMIGFTPENEAGVITQQLGTTHFIPIASCAYLNKINTIDNTDAISVHCFLQLNTYSNASNIWKPWLELLNKGKVMHITDNSLFYKSMVRENLGVGLLGSYALIDQRLLPIPLDVHIPLPVHISMLSDRLKSRPIRLIFDFLCEIFSDKNPWLNPQMVIEHNKDTTSEYEKTPC